eukprot:403353597
MVELENGVKYVIHNSPNNISYLGEGTNHEIVVREDQICEKWKMIVQWQIVEQNLTINDLVKPIVYKFYSTNCIHTARRVWKQLQPRNRIPFLPDRSDLKSLFESDQSLTNHQMTSQRTEFLEKLDQSYQNQQQRYQIMQGIWRYALYHNKQFQIYSKLKYKLHLDFWLDYIQDNKAIQEFI